MRKWISYAILCLLLPATVFLGSVLFEGRRYAWVSLWAVILVLGAFLVSVEKGEKSTSKMILIGVMTALSVTGRILFAPLPGFKPVTALVMMSAMYLGPQAGFATGAFCALISNFYFSQGPWTPFQMMVWGLLGFVSGLIAQPLKKSRILLLFVGAVFGVLYSLLMDVWTVLWADGYFNFTRYATYVVAAIPVTIEYAISNVVFLLLLRRPVGRILERIILKYGIGEKEL